MTVWTVIFYEKTASAYFFGGGGGGFAIPHFNLTEMGLPTIPLSGAEVNCKCDTSALDAAARTGIAQITANVDMMGDVAPVTGTIPFAFIGDGGCTGTLLLSESGYVFMLNLIVNPGQIYAGIIGIATQ